MSIPSDLPPRRDENIGHARREIDRAPAAQGPDPHVQPTAFVREVGEPLAVGCQDRAALDGIGRDQLHDAGEPRGGTAGGRKAHDVTATATMAAAMALHHGMRPLVVRRGAWRPAGRPWRRTAWLEGPPPSRARTRGRAPTGSARPGSSRGSAARCGRRPGGHARVARASAGGSSFRIAVIVSTAVVPRERAPARRASRRASTPNEKMSRPVVGGAGRAPAPATCSRPCRARRPAPCLATCAVASCPTGPRSLARQLGEAEVEDLDAAVVGDEQVLGLEVAMDDALARARRRARARSARAIVERLARRQRAPSTSRSRSVSPSSSSVTMYGAPSLVPTS